MNKLKVLKGFRDKNTLEYYSKGDTFESKDTERIAFLVTEGFLDKSETKESKAKTKKSGK